MIRKVMVLANACLIANLGRAASGALTPGRSGRGTVDIIRRRTVELNSGCRRRPSLRRRLGANLGASTAAPPITMPGISATSNNAAPAVITPMVAAVVTKSCVGLASLPARIGAVSANPRLPSTLYFDTALSCFHGRCNKDWEERRRVRSDRKNHRQFSPSFARKSAGFLSVIVDLWRFERKLMNIQ